MGDGVRTIGGGVDPINREPNVVFAEVRDDVMKDFILGGASRTASR
jgi:hypothetical protein